MDMPVEKNFHLESVMNVLEKFQAHNQVKKKKKVWEKQKKLKIERFMKIL